MGDNGGTLVRLCFCSFPGVGMNGSVCRWYSLRHSVRYAATCAGREGEAPPGGLAALAGALLPNDRNSLAARGMGLAAAARGNVPALGTGGWEAELSCYPKS